ncbi:MAG: cytochrome c [Phycisphaerales bacterium]
MTTKRHNTRRTTGQRLAFLAAFAAAGMALASSAGCRGDRSEKPPRQFFPDMDQQPKLKAQSESEFFADGRSQRLLVDRTVAFGSRPQMPDGVDNAAWSAMIEADRSRMLKADETFSYGIVDGSSLEEPEFVTYMPVAVTEDLLVRGKERFDIYCSACHGYTGVGGQADGAGTVGKLWSYSPANLLAEQYRDRETFQGKDGYLFHITRDGLWGPDGANRMPAYKHAINEQDAWAIVAYIRVLQASQGVAFDDLDPADQARLDRTGGTP